MKSTRTAMATLILHLLVLYATAQPLADTSESASKSQLTLAKRHYASAGIYRGVGFTFAGAAAVTGGVGAFAVAVEIVFLPITIFTGDMGFTKAEKWLTASLICGVVSIPFFVAAGNHTRKAKLLPYANTGHNFGPNVMLPSTASAGVTLQVRLGR